MKSRLATLALMAAIAMGTPIAAASTLPIIGGITEVKVTSFDLFNALGLDLALIGSATISGSVVTFPISGGEVDPATGFALIGHEGSGVGFTDGTIKATLKDLFIDTENALVTAAARFDGVNVGIVPLFSITNTLALLITDEAAEAINDTFGTSLVGGMEFGVASISPKVVPIPGAVWLFAGGLLMLLRVRRPV